MVEWKKLGEACQIKTGKLNANEQVENGLYPFFTCDATPYRIDNYAFDTEAILISGNGSQVGHLNYYKGKFNAYQRTYVLDKFKGIDVFYLYHFLKKVVRPYVMEKSKKGSVPYITLPMLTSLEIPTPSLSEQQRIVGILDTFTSSIENLKEQIAQRRKQYEYYRDQLLDLEGKEGVEIAPLRRIVKSYYTGATPNKGHLEYYESGTIPWLRTQDVKFNEIFEIDSFVTEEAVAKTGVKWIPANCVIVAISGATAGRCAINKIPTTTNQHCLNLEINPNKALYKYVYYCVYNAYSDMISKKQGARGDLNSSIILGITIPVPSLSEQQRIVSILDTFEASINNLEQQLAQREKQYEYYRNKLLTFE